MGPVCDLPWFLTLENTIRSLLEQCFLIAPLRAPCCRKIRLANVQEAGLWKGRAAPPGWNLGRIGTWNDASTDGFDIHGHHWWLHGHTWTSVTSTADKVASESLGCPPGQNHPCLAFPRLSHSTYEPFQGSEDRYEDDDGRNEPFRCPGYSVLPSSERCEELKRGESSSYPSGWLLLLLLLLSSPKPYFFL